MANVKGVKNQTLAAGRSFSQGELSALIASCDQSPIGVRDAVISAILYACGLRRSELVKLNVEDYDPKTGE